MCHYGKCIENACFYKVVNFQSHTLYFLTQKVNPESNRHCFFESIYKTCHIFYTWLGCIQDTHPFYLIDILFLQFININILLHTSISLILKLSLLGLHIIHHMLQRAFMKVNLDLSLYCVCYRFTLSRAKMNN